MVAKKFDGRIDLRARSLALKPMRGGSPPRDRRRRDELIVRGLGECRRAGVWISEKVFFV